MIRSRSIVASALAVAALLASAPTAADDTAEARRLFARGEREYAAGRYEPALAAYERAHALSGLPGFLFNIGVCHQRLEHWDDARAFLERYLAAVPDAPNLEDAQRLLAEVRAHLPPPAPPPPPSVEPPPAPPPPAPPPGDEPGPGWFGKIRPPAWIALGGSAVLGTLGVVFALDLVAAQDALDAPSLDCTLQTARCHALRDRGERAAALQVVFGVAGVAALAAAGVLATLDLTRTGERVRVAVGPASLLLEGTW